MRRLPDIIGGCLSSQPLRFLQDWLERELEVQKDLLKFRKEELSNKDYTEETLEFDKEYTTFFGEPRKIKTVEDLQELAEDAARHADLIKLCDDNHAEEIERHVAAMEELLTFIEKNDRRAITAFLRQEAKECEVKMELFPLIYRDLSETEERKRKQLFGGDAELLELLARLIEASIL